MNPFDQKPMPLEDTIIDWQTVYPKPYNKDDIDPYSRLRVILMNGIEAEATVFSHQFHRHCQDNHLRRELALLRRVEQLQQKHINWLKPIGESQLETTIGYEHTAVDLTAWLAQNEPDPYVKAALDFALLEDFDHLYRFANLLDSDKGIQAGQILRGFADVTPGRPTIAEHRHPADTVRRHVCFRSADIQTILNTMIITAGEQQTMNFYANIGNTYDNDPGRKLYQEIGMVEEEHVTHYGALLDPTLTWLENLLLHEYMECYLYYSFYEDEVCTNLKSVWELHLHQEIAHLHKAAELLQAVENKHWQQLVPGPFPTLLRYHDVKDYVRKILSEQVEWTCDLEDCVPVENLPAQHRFFHYQDRVNRDVNTVPSHAVIDRHIARAGQDYRAESQPNPIPQLGDRARDNTELGRRARVLA